MEYLGFVVNAREMTISLPEVKIKAIQKEATNIIIVGTLQLRILSHFIGTLVATKMAVTIAPLYFQALQHLKISLSSDGNLPRHCAAVTDGRRQPSLVERSPPGQLFHVNSEKECHRCN